MEDQESHLARSMLDHIGKSQPTILQRCARKEIVIGATCLAVITYIISLFVPTDLNGSNRADPLLKALTAIAAGTTFILSYIQWRLARHEISFDKFYDRINITNEYINMVGTKEADGIAEKEKDHLRNMRVFGPLDNLEYRLGKYQLDFVEFDIVDRVTRTFRSECDQDWFREKVLFWIGTKDGEQVAKGYHANTRKATIHCG